MSTDKKNIKDTVLKNQIYEADGDEEKTTEWCDGFEIVLKKEAEQSESLFWLHNKASLLASKFNDYIQIPSIVLQTVTGFLSATSGLVPSIALGSISIFTGVLTTILSYYKFSAKAEGHRVVAQLYMKIFKTIEVELSLPIAQRQNPQKLLDEVRDKLARISEVAPDIPDIIIELYNKTFKDTTTSKPIITNGLDEIIVYKEKIAEQNGIKIEFKR
jgi:hypothetical protein